MYIRIHMAENCNAIRTVMGLWNPFSSMARIEIDYISYVYIIQCCGIDSIATIYIIQCCGIEFYSYTFVSLVVVGSVWM